MHYFPNHLNPLIALFDEKTDIRIIIHWKVSALVFVYKLQTEWTDERF